MASTGLLLLLLMSSLFLLCSLSVPQPSRQQKLHSRQKRSAEFAMSIFGTVGTVLGIPPLIEWYIQTFKKVVLNERSDAEKSMKMFKENFEALSREQSITTKWHSWASGPYQEAEVNIKIGWKNFNDVVDECKTSCKDPKYKALFKTQHEHLVTALDKLHILLTTTETSFIPEFQSLLSDHVRCHEKEIINFSVLISELMLMGSTANALYYDIHEVNKLDHLAQMTFDTAALMSQIHRNCLLNPDKYIEMDVFDLINENQDRQQLAKDIKGILDKNYERYDWLVVAFLTTRSNQKSKWRKFLNKHLLKEFMEVTKGEVSVAVAKQAKGEHKKAEEIKAAITKCVPESTSCDSIKETLDKCEEKNGIVSKSYTAIHVYFDQSHDSAETLEEEITEGEEESKLPHIFTGKCKKMKLFKGQFRVMIKSDEEINGLTLCQNEKCGGAGECVPLPNILKETCKCKKDYYGLKCGTSLEDFKEVLRGNRQS